MARAKCAIKWTSSWKILWQLQKYR